MSDYQDFFDMLADPGILQRKMKAAAIKQIGIVANMPMEGFLAALQAGSDFEGREPLIIALQVTIAAIRKETQQLHDDLLAIDRKPPA